MISYTINNCCCFFLIYYICYFPYKFFWIIFIYGKFIWFY